MKRYSIVQRHKSRGIKTWYGRIADGPLVRYVSLGVTRKADAMEWLHLKNAEKFFPEKSPDAIADKDFNAASFGQMNLFSFLSMLVSFRPSSGEFKKVHETKYLSGEVATQWPCTHCTGWTDWTRKRPNFGF